MGVICDLQLDVGVGFLLTFDFSSPPTDRMKLKLISPLFPFDLSIVAFAPANTRDPPRPGIYPLTCDTIASLILDTINFLHKVGLKLRFPDLVA
jgi:hypothetical protein